MVLNSLLNKPFKTRDVNINFSFHFSLLVDIMFNHLIIFSTFIAMIFLKELLQYYKIENLIL